MIWLLTIICLLQLSLQNPNESNIKAVLAYYEKVFQTVYDNAMPTISRYNSTYYQYKISNIDTNSRETIERVMFIYYAATTFLIPYPHNATLCTAYSSYKRAFFVVDLFEQLYHSPNINVASKTAKLRKILQPFINYYHSLNKTSGRYATSDMMTLMDFSIDGNSNKDRGEYVSRRRFNYYPCCWGMNSVDTWERHYFWNATRYQPVSYISTDPVAVAHYGAFLSTGDYIVTWDVRKFGPFEQYQVRKGCEFGITTEHIGVSRSKRDYDGDYEGVTYRLDLLNNLHFTDLILIQSQRDNTYFHLNNDYSMWSKNNHSWFVMLNEMGNIPVAPDWFAVSEVSEDQPSPSNLDTFNTHPTHPTLTAPEQESYNEAPIYNIKVEYKSRI